MSRLTSEQLMQLNGWREDQTTRLAGEAPPVPPKFERLADRELVARDAHDAIKFFAQGEARKPDRKLDFLAEDMFHLLWPKTLPQVTENERPNLFEATRVS